MSTTRARRLLNYVDSRIGLALTLLFVAVFWSVIYPAGALLKALRRSSSGPR